MHHLLYVIVCATLTSLSISYGAADHSTLSPSSPSHSSTSVMDIFKDVFDEIAALDKLEGRIFCAAATEDNISAPTTVSSTDLRTLPPSSRVAPRVTYYSSAAGGAGADETTVTNAVLAKQLSESERIVETMNNEILRGLLKDVDLDQDLVIFDYDETLSTIRYDTRIARAEGLFFALFHELRERNPKNVILKSLGQSYLSDHREVGLRFIDPAHFTPHPEFKTATYTYGDVSFPVHVNFEPYARNVDSHATHTWEDAPLIFYANLGAYFVNRFSSLVKIEHEAQKANTLLSLIDMHRKLTGRALPYRRVYFIDDNIFQIINMTKESIRLITERLAPFSEFYALNLGLHSSFSETHILSFGPSFDEDVRAKITPREGAGLLKINSWSHDMRCFASKTADTDVECSSFVCAEKFYGKGFTTPSQLTDPLLKAQFNNKLYAFLDLIKSLPPLESPKDTA